MAKSSIAKVTPSVFDNDARNAVEGAINALYAIRRLAIRAVNELPRACGDAPSFCVAIKELSLLHGKALDDCVKRIARTPGVGCFDGEFIDYEEPAHG